MYLLSPTDYHRILPLCEELDNHLPVRAIVQGTMTGDVYVNDPGHPQAMLIDVRHRRLYLAGNPVQPVAEAVGRLLNDVIYPAARTAGVPLFSLCCAPLGWEAHLDVLLPGMSPIHTERQYYEWTAGLPRPQATLRKGYALLPADARLLAAGQLANLDALTEEMLSERASVDDFLARSFGVCPVTPDALVGWCLSEYNTDDRCEVGIATLPPHQGKGLATATGAAFIQHALAHGITRIGWHCFADNRPSWATALKLGFRKVEDYSAYIVWCNIES